ILDLGPEVDELTRGGDAGTRDVRRAEIALARMGIDREEFGVAVEDPAGVSGFRGCVLGQGRADKERRTRGGGRSPSPRVSKDGQIRLGERSGAEKSID